MAGPKGESPQGRPERTPKTRFHVTDIATTTIVSGTKPIKRIIEELRSTDEVFYRDASVIGTRMAGGLLMLPSGSISDTGILDYPPDNPTPAPSSQTSTMRLAHANPDAYYDLIHKLREEFSELPVEDGLTLEMEYGAWEISNASKRPSERAQHFAALFEQKRLASDFEDIKKDSTPPQQ